MQLTPTLDIIIPTYNRADCIGDALDSCGTHPVIVLDDGSTDNTRDVVARYPQETLEKFRDGSL